MVKNAFLLGLVCLVWLGVPTAARADWYDSFNDGYYERDPNDPRYDANDPYWTYPNNIVAWDVDNPDWVMYDVVTNGIFAHFIDNGWLRLYCQGNAIFGLAFMGGGVDDGVDPNISKTFFDDSASHYIMAHTKISDPNNQVGATYVLLHSDIATLTGHGFRKGFHPNDLEFAIVTFNGLNYEFGIKKAWPDPNTEPDGANGFWFALQFDPDDANGTGDANDPNNHWFRVAAWNGAKHDWDGQWFIEQPLLYPNWPPGDPNLGVGWDDGVSLVAAAGSVLIGMVPDMSHDNVAARWGMFTNLSRALTITTKDCCALHIDPDLLDDPNHDPNSLSELRRYTQGTSVVLHAVVPCGNKSFKKWKIMGPNDTGDPNYQIVSDTNDILYLTMNGDYEVKAVCKCGGGGIEPFAGIVLLVLGLGVAIRRIT